MCHFLKPLKLTQELSQKMSYCFGMAVAFIMFIKELRRNRGETAATAENRHQPRFFLPFLKKISLIFALNNCDIFGVIFFWLSSCVSFNGFKKWNIRPPPSFDFLIPV